MHGNNLDKILENENINSEIENILHDKRIDNDELDEEFNKHKIKAEKVLKNKEKPEKVLKKAKWICDMLSNIPFLGKFFVNVSIMCDMIADYIKGVYKNVPLATIVTVLAAILYMISPVDLLPDALPVIGAIDDIAILNGVLMAAKKDIEEYKNWKELNNETVND